MAMGSEPVVYAGEGGWVAVAGLDETGPPSAWWQRIEDLWVGRFPEGEEILHWGDRVLPLADALAPPLAPTLLPPVRNAFGPCVVRSLSVRFESQIRAHRWSLVFAREGEEPEISPLVLAHGPPVSLDMWLEDIDQGQVWPLRPERMGREGGMFERQKGEARLYAGMLDEDRLEWHLVVARSPAGRRIVQIRIRSFDNESRRFRLRVAVRTGARGDPVLQDESPPAVVAVDDGVAVALFVDLAEPRRYRMLAGETDGMGLEFDLAVTRATGNFPRSATVSLELDAWPTAGMDAAPQEALERLAVLAALTALPEDLLEQGPGTVPVFEPSRLVLTHPGGFHDTSDALHYLLLRMTGLFEDYDWHSSGFLCLAQDADDQPSIRLEDDRAILAINPDPDLETMLEMGQNRGLTLLRHVLGSGAEAVWIRAGREESGLDHHMRGLYMCDYPAVWDERTGRLGVDVRHAEAELIASLACVLKDHGVALLVEDAGPLAPFTTVYADALVCDSVDPAEMRRQRALAGARPVAWTPTAPTEESRALARELEFLTLGPAPVQE